LNSFIFLPIIISIRLNIDDYSRAIYGTLGWTSDARPVADLFNYGLSLGAPIAIQSPLFQLIALVLVSLTCVIATRAYQVISPWLGALATFPLAGQPYFLANLSFGFDSASMALAQLFAIGSSVALLSSSTSASFVISTSLLLAALLTYQPSASSFLAFGLGLTLSYALGMQNIIHPSSWKGKLFRLTTCYVSAFGLFAIYVKFLWKSPTQYAASASELLPLTNDFLVSLARNAISFLRIYREDWASTPLPILLALLLATALTLAARSWKHVFLIPVAYFCILLISPGAVVFLVNPVSHYPRTLVFIGPLLCSLCLQIAASISGRRGTSSWGACIGLAPIGILAWFMILFAFTYAHTAEAQEQFVEGRISRIVAGVNQLETELPEGKKLETIAYEGRMPNSPVLENSSRKFPLIYRLLYPIIRDNEGIGLNVMRFNGFPSLQTVDDMPAGLSDEACRGQASSALCTSEYIMAVQDKHLKLKIR